jgi:hypothetical protein
MNKIKLANCWKAQQQGMKWELRFLLVGWEGLKVMSRSGDFKALKSVNKFNQKAPRSFCFTKTFQKAP